MPQVQAWFDANVQHVLQQRGITVQLRSVAVLNTINKPGPVFLAMARAAYDWGADYLYRVTDDTEFLTPFASAFVYTLAQLSPPYGVVGPIVKDTPNRILTQDFTHRTHMEVFLRDYYPPEFTDWWCDDWISVVYGAGRTFTADKVLVAHHMHTYGKRYRTDHSVLWKVKRLKRDGRIILRDWMQRHGAAEEELKQFDADSADQFQRKSAPSAPPPARRR